MLKQLTVNRPACTVCGSSGGRPIKHYEKAELARAALMNITFAKPEAKHIHERCLWQLGKLMTVKNNAHCRHIYEPLDPTMKNFPRGEFEEQCTKCGRKRQVEVI